MSVHVRDGLARLGAGVEDDAVTGVGDAFSRRDPVRPGDHVAEQPGNSCIIALFRPYHGCCRVTALRSVVMVLIPASAVVSSRSMDILDFRQSSGGRRVGDLGMKDRGPWSCAIPAAARKRLNGQ
jgi:hypothetical protein